MTINEILSLNISDTEKVKLIKAFQEGGITTHNELIYELNPTETISIGGKSYDVEIADTEEKRKEGLSKVTRLEEDEGMLFIYDEVISGYYTLEDTSIDLDVIFIDDEAEVIQVSTVKAHSDEKIQCRDFKYVLEVNSNSGIKEGDMLMSVEDEFDEEEKKTPINKKMLILDSDGNVQGKIDEGCRIFSRIFTRKMIKQAIKAYKSDQDSDYIKLGRMVFKELNALDSRSPEYVEAPKPQKTEE